jgi:RimJ/RimL family protein N-acetyltransferase
MAHSTEPGSPCRPTLETERLRLRPFCEDDFEDYAALCADPEVARYLGRGTLSREQSWRILVFFLGHWQVRGYGMWVAEERVSGAFVGAIGFAEPYGWPGFELAWSLVRRFWGRGYATEGARAALAHAFTGLHKDHVISLIHPANRASVRVAERLGQRPEGCAEVLGMELLVYGINRRAWAAEVPVGLRRSTAHAAAGT